MIQIRQEEKEGIIVFYATGEIDVNTCAHFKKAFDKVIGDKKEKVILSLKDVSYVDSSGLAALVEILKAIKAYGGRLKLTDLSGKVENLFKITKLEKLFDIVSKEDEAIKELS